MVKKLVCVFCVVFSLLLPSLECEASQFFTDDSNIVIVIDPGHGGENYGTDVNPAFLEKDINLITANALIEELSKYSGVTVYSTRTTDTDLSLKERAKFAEKVNADFLISIHYNASVNHTLFGAEVWIPMKAPYHAPAYQFAYLQLQEMEEMGLFIRGIKTRANDNGNDYYGIIRESVAREIPAVIIEHCHVDEERDSLFVSTEEMFREFGRRDAQAIVRFLNLDGSSEALPQELQILTQDSTMANTYNDYIEPDICSIEVTEADYENGRLFLSVTARDASSHIQYYDYSLDGGRTYSIKYPWPDCNGLTGAYPENITIEIAIPENTRPRVIVRAYNKFDLIKDSNMLDSLDVFCPITLDGSETYDILEVYAPGVIPEISPDTAQKPSAPFTGPRVWLLAGFSVFWLSMLVLGICIVRKCFKNSKHR